MYIKVFGQTSAVCRCLCSGSRVYLACEWVTRMSHAVWEQVRALRRKDIRNNRVLGLGGGGDRAWKGGPFRERRK